MEEDGGEEVKGEVEEDDGWGGGEGGFEEVFEGLLEGYDG